MIPTSIDGTDITGATIDGTDVTEITVDGQTVFSAAPDAPVAVSNLIAWYPFDASAVGGTNLTDVSSLLTGVHDSTDYSLSIDGSVTHQASAGVTDINAGANSGAYDFSGSFPYLDANTGIFNNESALTYMGWVKFDSRPAERTIVMGNPKYTSTPNTNVEFRPSKNAWNFEFVTASFGFNFIRGGSMNAGDWYHLALTYDGSDIRGYATEEGASNVSLIDTKAMNGTYNPGFDFVIGNNNPGPNTSSSFDGSIDDVRLYNTDLSTSQIQTIFDNTKP